MNIMLDLETWGLTPGSDIRSIGACVFAPETGLVHDGSLGTIRPFYSATATPEALPLTRDPETVKWWNDQSEKAQAAFANPADLWSACYSFNHWIWSVCGSRERFENWTADEGIRIWCKGPHFDVSILAAIYRAIKMPVPWHYRSPRDMRTVVDIAKITKDEERAMFTGTPHHALDDAISQAKVVCEAFKRLRLTDGREA